MNERAQQVWNQLLEGNGRFRESRPQRSSYVASQLRALEAGQKPKSAVIACSDSRVDPLVIFDQALGDMFVSRVPGNVASDGAKWMVELAIAEFNVPLIVVLAHSGCLAVHSVVEWSVGGPGGFLRMHVLPSAMRAEGLGAEKLANAVRLNALHTVEQLLGECPIARDAEREGRTTFVIAHRLSTIRRADQILVVEGGRIVERGNHAELYALRGRYYDLYTRQHGLEANLFLAPGEGDVVDEAVG